MRLRSIGALCAFALRAFVSCLVFCACLPSMSAEIANSTDQWSFGDQGLDSWTNGYYNLTQDADGMYGVGDFIEFLNDGSGFVDIDDLNHWNGNQFLLYRDTDATGGNTGPWTRVGQETGHPNGTNSAPPFSVPGSQAEEHWPIRRWTADDITEPTELTLEWHLRKQNTNCGDGTGGILFHNGIQIDRWTVGSADDVGVTRGVGATISPGDIVDLALTPVGNDGCDGSFFTLRITDDPPPDLPEPPIADSVADFSGVQGQDNWFYGYYDLRDDADNGDGFYSPEDFIEFLNDGSNVVSDDSAFGGWMDHPNHWDGGKWDLLNNGAVANGPWTEVTAGGGHPAANAQGDDSVHWNIRRWISEVNGDIEIAGTISNGSGNGDGTIGRIFVDGEEVWSEFTDGFAVPIELTVPVNLGSVVDFATDPDGSEVYDPSTGAGVDLVADGADGTSFSFTITSLTDPNALQAGDANQDLSFDQLDIIQVSVANKYLSGNPATWGEGDWNGAPGGSVGNPPPGNGFFDQLDIIAGLSAGKYLTGPYAVLAPGGDENDEQTSLVYDQSTGELRVDAPASTELTSIFVTSAGNLFVGDKPPVLDGPFDSFAPDNIFKSTIGSSFGDSTFGNVLPAGLSEDAVLADLTASGSMAGGGGLGEVDLVYIPEPSSLVLLGLALVPLIIVRRRPPMGLR